MTTYDITVTRDGRFWFIEIPALDGATQARNLAEVDEMARDYIANVTEADPSTIEIRRETVLPEDVLKFIAEAALQRETEAEARRNAALASRMAALTLKNAGLTVRDIGAALNISFQRAQQLVTDDVRSS